MSETTYEGRTQGEWESLRDKAIRIGDLLMELYCNAHVRLMEQGRTDATHPEEPK